MLYFFIQINDDNKPIYFVFLLPFKNKLKTSFFYTFLLLQTFYEWQINKLFLFQFFPKFHSMFEFSLKLKTVDCWQKWIWFKPHRSKNIPDFHSIFVFVISFSWYFYFIFFEKKGTYQLTELLSWNNFGPDNRIIHHTSSSIIFFVC